MEDSVLIGIIVVFILVIGAILLMKKEHFGTLNCSVDSVPSFDGTSCVNCPTGFVKSISGVECVLPGESVTCNPEQRQVGNTCRYLIGIADFEKDMGLNGWNFDSTMTGLTPGIICSSSSVPSKDGTSCVNCPTGFVKSSIDAKQCVLPGESLPPCKAGQHLENGFFCRYPLLNLYEKNQIPNQWVLSGYDGISPL